MEGERGRMDADAYRQALDDLFSDDPDRVREANRRLFSAAVGDDKGGDTAADLVITQVELVPTN